MTNSKNVILKKYHNFLNVFFKQKADKLLFHKKYDHFIEWMKRKKVSTKILLYRMSEQKLELMKTYFE